MSATRIERLTQLLWPHGDDPGNLQVYWLLDGARDTSIAPLVHAGRLEYACLFTGELDARLEAAAPYLVHLGAGSPMTNQLLQRGWGNAWGIMVSAPPHITLTMLRRHFKKLLRVQTEDGREMFFRFYDPRVLRLYLPICTAVEFRAFLGPLASFIVEDDGGARLGTYESNGKQRAHTL